MKRKTILTAALVAAFFLNAIAQANKAKTFGRAVICLTYDDGLTTQLTTAIPQLNSFGLKATFFLSSIQGTSQSETIGQTPEAVLGWTAAAKQGHELANHTLFHPCPSALGWDKSVAIDGYTVERMVTEVRTQNGLLSLLNPSRKGRAFAFPCNNAFIGKTDYAKRLKKDGLITFARAGGDSNSVITNFKKLDPIKVPSWHVWTGTTLQALILFAENAKRTGGMAVFQFHGVGGQIFQISGETHRAFLHYLKEHEADYWVATFSAAMEFVTKK